LADEEETTITGRLCEAIEVFLREPSGPAWRDFLFLAEDPPVNDSGKTGKRRDRVDVEIATTSWPRPVFSFEAKPLRDSHSVANYVGPDGMGCFVRGQYASDFDFGGILGYVCSRSVDTWITAIESKLDEKRATLGLHATEAVWVTEPDVRSLSDTRRSRHERAGRCPIDLYHSFIMCHSGSSRASASPAGRAKM
jgi:hypothetical protein